MRLRIFLAFLLLTVIVAPLSAARRRTFSVALVFECGEKNPMYSSSRGGVTRALSAMRAKISQTLCDNDPKIYESAIEKAAERNSLVIAVGAGLNAAVSAAADKFPETDFVLVDAKANHPAVSSVLFRQNESSYLAGALAAQLITDYAAEHPGNPRVCGIILGERGAEYPVALDFMAGYVQGVRDTSPDIQILCASVDSWDDPSRAHEIATEMRRRSAGVIFQAAGVSGTGVIQAALERFFWVIGTDEAQEHIAPGVVLTAVLKNYDTAIYDIISLKYSGHLARGMTYFYGLSDRGTRLSWSSSSLIPDDIRRRLEGLTYRISDGEIVVTSCYESDGSFRKDLRPLPPGGKIMTVPQRKK